jgi:hypothetical protein
MRIFKPGDRVCLPTGDSGQIIGAKFGGNFVVRTEKGQDVFISGRHLTNFNPPQPVATSLPDTFWPRPAYSIYGSARRG